MKPYSTKTPAKPAPNKPVRPPPLTETQSVYAEADARDFVGTRMSWVGMLGGDVLAAILFAQIRYWHLPGENKRTMTKLSIFKDGRFWLAKSHVDFTKETGLTQNQQRKKLKVMEDLGLVTTRVWKFNAVPTLHVSINSEVYNQMHMEAMHKRFGISEEPAEYADFDPSDDENLDDY